MEDIRTPGFSKEFFDKIKGASHYRFIVLILFAFIVIQHVILVAHYPYAPFIASDPSAAYLASAIYILECQRPYYFDHPGSAYYTLLALGLIPFKFYAFINRINFIEFVYLYKEIILIYLQFFTLLFSLTGLYLLSRAVVRMTKKEWTGLFVLLLFLSLDKLHYQRLWLITVEGYLVFISGLTLFFFSKYLLDKQEARYLYLSFLSLGLGFAGKPILLPLGIFLFFFLAYEIGKTKDSAAIKVKRVAGFFGTAVFGFLLGTAVLGSRLGRYFSFVYGTLIHSGKYTKGGIGIDFINYAQNIVRILKIHGFFVALLISAQAVLFHYTKSKKADAAASQIIAIGAFSLAASAIYVAIQSIEPFNTKYIIIALLLLSFSFAVKLPILIKDRKIPAIFFVLVTAFGAALQWKYARQADLEYIQANRDMEQLIEKHNIDLQHDVIIFDKGRVKNKNIYFIFANMYSFGMYDSILYKYQPNILLYNIHRNMIVRYDREKYEGKWRYAIIAKYVEKHFNALKVLNAKIIDQQGRYYLMAPALDPF